MIDQKPSYAPERSVAHNLVNIANKHVREARQWTPNEAADENHLLRDTNLRWLPAKF